MPERGNVLSSRYQEAVCEAMQMLSSYKGVIFLGQAVGYPGTAMFNTLKNVPMESRIELPVAEEMQMGMSIGLALSGHIPVTIYPRYNFLLLAANQLVNHLDKMADISGRAPKVIIRVGIGSMEPMDPGPQHTGDMTEAFRLLVSMPIISLERAEDIVPAYRAAVEADGPTILVEHMDRYNA